jgi:hypothetical protein
MKRAFATAILMSSIALAGCMYDAGETTSAPTTMQAAHEATWICRTPVMVQDANSTGAVACSVNLSFDNEYVTAAASGIPNHDFASGPGCCAVEQEFEWILPLTPIPAATLDDVPRRGAIAVSVNGAAIYGPEDGPGGDAVASGEGMYVEDRQEIWMDQCHGHSGPGGQYHYHADAGCIHWHDDDYEWGATTSNDPKVVGWAFDGYPIYSLTDSVNGANVEVRSSYRLLPGENGYNGVSDYEYVQGFGDLDSCNGHEHETALFTNGIYHYHSSRINGAGNLGFPYFMYCYYGEVDGAIYDTAGEGNGVPPGDGPPGGPPGQGPPPGGIQ